MPCAAARTCPAIRSAGAGSRTRSGLRGASITVAASRAAAVPRRRVRAWLSHDPRPASPEGGAGRGCEKWPAKDRGRSHGRVPFMGSRLRWLRAGEPPPRTQGKPAPRSARSFLPYGEDNAAGKRSRAASRPDRVLRGGAIGDRDRQVRRRSGAARCISTVSAPMPRAIRVMLATALRVQVGTRSAVAFALTSVFTQDACPKHPAICSRT